MKVVTSSLPSIVAVATPKGCSALAIIRISGNDSHEIFVNSVKEKSKFVKAKSSFIKIYTLQSSDNNIIDEVTAIKYCSPYSYTGENMVEIIAHGNSLLIEKILEQLSNSGASYAVKGEFTRRAFINGKKTLNEAESINKIITNKNSEISQNIIKHYFGEFRNKIFEWKRKVEKILVDIESNIEFSEEDDVLDMDQNNAIKINVSHLRGTISKEIEKFSVSQPLEKGFVVLFIGDTNVGKSTLFNSLLGYDRSIVAKNEGTTRDFVTETLNINTHTVTFVDTAGIRETGNNVEVDGINRTKALIDKAHFILWVTSYESDDSFLKHLIVDKMAIVAGVINKIDINRCTEKEMMFKKMSLPVIKTSAVSSSCKKELEKFIVALIESNYAEDLVDSAIGNKRQWDIARKIVELLTYVEKYISSQEEIAALYCRDILGLLDQYTGKTVDDDILNAIFDEFCIGK